MTDAIDENQALTQQAVTALQAGESKKARELFEKVVASGLADTSVWLGLAFACAQSDDKTRTLDAVNTSIELDPQNLRAIIFKADHLLHLGDSRNAIEIYQQALQLASGSSNLPGDVQQGLKRAQENCIRIDDEYKAFLTTKMKAEGFSPGKGNSRFQQSLDIILESQEVYYQEPKHYYFPGLPQIQFYEREQFDWVESIESATDDIRAELTNVMGNPSLFSPYLKSEDMQLDENNKDLLDNNDWGALYLWEYGRLVEEKASLFPLTIKALEAAPLPLISSQSPMALFSRLTSGTRIPPHNGLLNTRLICHLPIIVPKDCGALRVGNEQRPWVEGEMLIFDDSIEHEAWNTSKKERVILLFEVWRPELNEEERQLVSTLLAAVKEYHKG
ncbi:MAG: aspartyl beta-hydroxylase [Gammaproteobacteria bacterium]|jgi:aspartate beta-hydroxylase|nr:aspartyl beta-hydroxylase [Gammaproteobacteria bacterium]